MQNSENPLSASNQKVLIPQAQQNQERYPLILKIQKRELKFYYRLRESNPDTLHNKALIDKERSPLRQLDLAPRQKPHQTKLNYKKIKRNYLTHRKQSTKKQSKLKFYLALNEQHSVADHLTTVTVPVLRKSLTVYRLSLTVERGHHRQTCLHREDRLCTHCAQQEVKTQLHFSTTILYTVYCTVLLVYILYCLYIACIQCTVC